MLLRVQQEHLKRQRSAEAGSDEEIASREEEPPNSRAKEDFAEKEEKNSTERRFHRSHTTSHSNSFE